MKYNSVADIIGPVMVGPSSSHTAGAVRIGKMARSIYGGQAEEADIYFYGSFAHTFKGHGTNVATVAGLLGLSTYDDRIPEALELAEERNFKVKLIPSSEPFDHPNTARMVLRGELGEVSVVGVSIGGGNAEIREINGYKVLIDAYTATTIILHQDKAGVIASVTNVFGQNGINIAHMEVARKERGEVALMSIETDSEVSDKVLEDIRALNHVHNVIQVRR